MTQRRLRSIAVLVLLAAATSGCSSDRRAISRDDLPDVPSEPTAVVHVDEDGFRPDRVEVGTDGLVEFRNDGDEDHGIRTEDFAIDTGLLQPGESTDVRFDRPATYEISDPADDRHTMTVVATAPPPAG